MEKLVRIFLVVVLLVTVFLFIKFKAWNNLSNQFDSLYEENKYSEALWVAERQLASAKGMFFLSRFFIAPSLNNFGRVYYGERKFSEAEEYYKRALELAQRTFGKDSPRIKGILENMVVLYRVMENQEEAQKYMQRLDKIKTMKK
jgi:tetratricopeptide (TPR) repeat protein